MARMHWNSLKYCRENRFMQALLNISFVLPFILVILWIRPISREYLTNRIFSGMDQPLYVSYELTQKEDVMKIYSNIFLFTNL